MALLPCEPCERFVSRALRCALALFSALLHLLTTLQLAEESGDLTTQWRKRQRQQQHGQPGQAKR